MDDRQESQVGRNIKYRQSHRQVIDSLLKGASKQRVKERRELGQDRQDRRREKVGWYACRQAQRVNRNAEKEQEKDLEKWNKGRKE